MVELSFVAQVISATKRGFGSPRRFRFQPVPLVTDVGLHLGVASQRLVCYSFIVPPTLVPLTPIALCNTSLLP